MGSSTVSISLQSKPNIIIPYNDRLAPLYIRQVLYSLIPDGTEHIYVIGIGSSRINGDSLGPFVGSLLKNNFSDHLTVLGNLQAPLDATTLVPELGQLSFRNNSFVIAIDSVLGSDDYVNSIVVKDGPVVPGVGLGNILPPIGDCSITGVVLENDPALKNSLLCTDLNLVYTMATSIAKGISLTVRQYYKYPSSQPLLVY
ncbi:spore protease YyaC [Neobacillus sp. 179-C4.2 HS]|uniref:Spore protease YyaC n=1 Tax=Neobacillus driksii TaxID=3035913 RepID=A0ABV4YQQ7_9BACI|nr:spore protease YyaC [Neobacillus sp. 179.-C4.2 HS]MDP5197059.1 spore protease YyaC [Neobacillus sp. 179.-C4.2 HS]